MPKVTIWIREEDVEQWEAIADRPEWLHQKLSQEKKLNDYMETVKSTDPLNKPIPKRRPRDTSMDVEDQSPRVDDDVDWGA